MIILLSNPIDSSELYVGILPYKFSREMRHTVQEMKEEIWILERYLRLFLGLQYRFTAVVVPLSTRRGTPNTPLSPTQI